MDYGREALETDESDVFTSLPSAFRAFISSGTLVYTFLPKKGITGSVECLEVLDKGKEAGG